MAPSRKALALAALAGLAAAGWWLGLRREARRAPRVLLLTPAVQGVDAATAFGLGRLLRDEWEVGSDSTLLAASDPLPAGLSPEDTLLRVSGRRAGSSLSLRLEWRSAAGPETWETAETPMLPPAEALRRLAAAGPFRAWRPGAEHLLPTDPDRFWVLAASASVQDDVAANAGLEASRALVEAESGSAAAWANYGEHIYRNLWTEPAGGDLPQTQALEAFDRALALVPGYPRAALLKGMLLTDIGDQREALRALVDARALRPWNPDLYGGLAYAGRTSGLLDGALRAVAARERLTRPLPLDEEWFAENTFLYTGQWDAFQANLQGRHDPVFLFYQGYLELARGRGDRALPFFLEGAGNRRTSVPFSDLCAIYAAALQGHPDEAFSRLRTFEAERGRLRIPDGELTFKVAEAYAYLGHPDEALGAAGRAFAQGFGCLPWYEQSPLFAAARQSPRWTALRQHILERQQLLARSFPPSAFG